MREKVWRDESFSRKLEELRNLFQLEKGSNKISSDFISNFLAEMVEILYFDSLKIILHFEKR